MYSLKTSTFRVEKKNEQILFERLTSYNMGSERVQTAGEEDNYQALSEV